MAVSDADYASTLAVTDTVNSGTGFNAVAGFNLAVDSRGMLQGALYDLLNNIVTNINALNAKLDADGGVNLTNYAATCNLTALASQGNGLSKLGMHQKDLVAMLTEMETNWNAILTKLDGDSGVTDTDYNSSHAVNLNDTVVGSNGLSQADIVSFLGSLVDNFNLCLTKLDND